MSFTASISGIEQLKQDLSQENLDKQVLKAIGQVTARLHSVLTEQVKQDYNIGSRSLNTALQGSTTSHLKRGAGFIESGLVYSSPRIPLSEFPQTITFSSNVSSFIAPNIFTPLLRGKVQRQKPIEVISVGIRKDKLTLIKGGFRGKIRGKRRIMRRGNFFIGGQTWKKLPTPDDLIGERKTYFEVNGISLSEMAANVYDHNRFALKFQETFSQQVADRLKLWQKI